jgi:hypothetical protein
MTRSETRRTVASIYDQVKEDEMEREKRKEYTILVGNPE